MILSPVITTRLPRSVSRTASMTLSHAPAPTIASASGISSSNSCPYRCPRHPAIIRERHRPLSLYSDILSIVVIDSSFADSMKAQVLTINISASAGSLVISMPLSLRIPSIVSVSTRFLEHPRLIQPAFKI